MINREGGRPETSIAILGMMIVGGIIRISNLSFQRMNYDEEFTIAFAAPSLDLIQLILKTLTHDFTPPLYYIAAHFSMMLFGPTAFAIRYPSVLFGVLLIPVMYFIGEEYKDERFGTLLAAFTTIMYNFVFYSRYGRDYSMELFFFAIAFYLFMRLIKERSDREGFYFIIFALLSVWTHLYAIIPIAIMIAYLKYQDKISYIPIILFGICCLPLLNYISLIFNTRNYGIYSGASYFGATVGEIFYLTPFDLFGYSAVLIFPIVVWQLWKHRDDELFKVISLIFGISWISLFVLSFVTPIIIHYIIYLVPMLLLPFILPFYEQFDKEEVSFYWVLIAFVILVLEATQLFFFYTIQRGLG